MDATITCSMFTPDPLLTLEDGVPSDPISLEATEVQSFVLFIEPHAQVICETQGGLDGNANLFLRFDALPDISNGIYDCIGSGATSVESCSLEDPGFAMAVYGTIVPFSSSFTDLTVTCSSMPPLPVIVLSDGVASGPYSLSTGFSQTFVLDVTSITGGVVCQTRGDVGDCDLYTRIDQEPDIFFGAFDCESFRETSYEECVVADLEAATSLFVTLYAFSSFSDLTLACTSYSGSLVQQVPPVELFDGVPSAPFSLNLHQFQNFKLELTNPSTSVVCTVNADDGDADIYVLLDGEPNVSAFLFQCAGNTFSSNETCEVATLGASSVWAQVVAFEAFTNAITTCTTGILSGEPTTLDPSDAPSPSTMPALAPTRSKSKFRSKKSKAEKSKRMKSMKNNSKSSKSSKNSKSSKSKKAMKGKGSMSSKKLQMEAMKGQGSMSFKKLQMRQLRYYG